MPIEYRLNGIEYALNECTGRLEATVAKHVDVVVSRWQVGVDERVAAFFPKENRVRAEIFNSAFDYLQQLADEVQAQSPGRGLSRALAEALNSTYVTVIPLHTDAHCLFSHGNEVPMGESAVDSAAR
jgi:hypothetical protein